jgi:hypothetical protein
MKGKFLKSFSVYDLLLIAMFCALAIAFKAVVKILIGFVATPLGIPGGALAGGLYMLWMPLCVGIVGKRGSALLMTLIQCIILYITGMPGGHGIWTFATYMLPALAVELVLLLKGKNGFNVLHFMLSCVLANIVGTMGSNVLFFQLYDPVWLTFVISSATFSGAIGGVLGYMVYKATLKSGLIDKLSGETVKQDVVFEKLNAPTSPTPFDKVIK